MMSWSIITTIPTTHCRRNQLNNTWHLGVLSEICGAWARYAVWPTLLPLHILRREILCTPTRSSRRTGRGPGPGHQHTGPRTAQSSLSTMWVRAFAPSSHEHPFNAECCLINSIDSKYVASHTYRYMYVYTLFLCIYIYIRIRQSQAG